jgi:hypothetical protein
MNGCGELHRDGKKRQGTTRQPNQWVGRVLKKQHLSLGLLAPELALIAHGIAARLGPNSGDPTMTAHHKPQLKS